MLLTVWRRSRRLVGLWGLLASSWAHAAVQEYTSAHDPREKIYQFQLDGVDFATAKVIDDKAASKLPRTYQKARFQQVQLRGVDRKYSGILYRIGEPQLPVLRFFVDGDANTSVRIEAGSQAQVQQLNAESFIVPNQASRIKLPTVATSFAFNASVYKQGRLIPENDYEVVVVGSVRGKTRYQVTLYPFRYAPGKNSYSLTKQFTVRVQHAAQVDTKQTAQNQAIAFVVGEKFANSPALANYAALKAALGIHVDTIVVRSNDTPDSIRTQLKALYARPELSLHHALIIGDADDVPARESEIISGRTDHYYAAIDTDDYLSDINTPDIGVGRIAVHNEAELAAVLAKYTRYIKGHFSAEKWLNSLSFLATDDQYEIAESSHNYVIQNYTAPLAYHGNFPQPNQLGGDQLYAITHKASDDQTRQGISQGRGIINYSGHGSNTSWAGPNISQDDVRRLNDPDALPFVISNACITGDYRVDESFAETWQRHPAGAVVFWGSMDSTYWDEDDILERRLYDAIYRDGQLEFASMTHYALAEMWRHYGGAGRSQYYWETYHVFGDPSLDLRTTSTKAVQVQGPKSLPLGSAQVVYSLSDAVGNPIKGARAGLSDGSTHLSAMSDDEGRFSFDIANLTRSVKTMQLTVAGRNTQLSQSDLDIVRVDAAFLAMDHFEVNQRNKLLASPGETLTLGMLISNWGERATQGARVWIDAVQGPAFIVAGEARIPALPAGQSYQFNTEALRVALADTAQSGESVRMRLNWQTDEGQTGSQDLSLRVIRGELKVNSLSFASSEVEGIRPGEAGDVYVTVQNTGSEAIKNMRLVAEPGACVDGIEGELLLAQLLPGASVKIPQALRVSVAAQCQAGDVAALKLRGVYSSAAKDLGLQAATSFLAGALIVRSYDAGALNIDLPDGGSAMTQTLTVDAVGLLQDIGVYVKVEHSYIGDLEVKLIHPDGTQVMLHDRVGNSAHNIDKIYGLGGEASVELKKLLGKSAEGVWKLSVQDQASQDVGQLQEFKLSVRGYLR